MAQNDWQINIVNSNVPTEGLAVFHNSLSNPLSGSEFGDYCRYFRHDTGNSNDCGFMARLKNPAALSIPDTKAISVRSWVRMNSWSNDNYAFIFAKDYCGSCWNNSDSRSGYHFGIKNGDFRISAKGHTLMSAIDANPILGYDTGNNWVHIRLDVIPIKHNGAVIIDHVKGFVEVEGVWQLVTERYIEATDSEFVPWQSSTPSYVGFGAYSWNYWTQTWWDKFEVFTETVEQPGSLTLALTNDTGASNQDKITSDSSITVSAPDVGAEREYSLDLTNWSASMPTFTSGSNVLYARQVSAEGRTSPISTLEFTYIPDDSHLTITSAATASVVENSGESQVVYTAAAENPFSSVKYILKEVDDYQKLSMSTTNGQVTLFEDPNFEVSSSYNFTFEVEDLAGFTKEQAVVLSVLDQNEEHSFQVSFNNGTQLNPLAESTAIDYVVATLSAIDPENDTITFSLVSQTVDGTFAVSSSSLVLTGTLDYETNSSHVVTLRASDGEFDIDQAYTIYVSDANDAPVLTVEMVAGTVDNPLAENASSGTTIANISATDADGDSLEFSIVSQTVADMFAIEGGTLVLDGALDYETNQSHTVVLRVTDGITSVDQSKTIYVSDVNESPSLTLALVTGSQSQPLLEDAVIDTVLGTLSSTDQEGDSVTFSITSQTVAGTFALSGSSLVLTGALDYEANATHTVSLRASDGTNNTDQDHTIYIGNINDNAPAFSLSLSTGTSNNPVPENSSTGLVLGTLSATDADGDSVTFSLVSQTVSGMFEISGSSLKLAGTLDYAANTSHTLTIRASDGLNATDANHIIYVQDI